MKDMAQEIQEIKRLKEEENITTEPVESCPGDTPAPESSFKDRKEDPLTKETFSSSRRSLKVRNRSGKLSPALKALWLEDPGLLLLSQRDFEGRIPLHYAAMTGNVDLIDITKDMFQHLGSRAGIAREEKKGSASSGASGPGSGLPSDTLKTFRQALLATDDFGADVVEHACVSSHDNLAVALKREVSEAALEKLEALATKAAWGADKAVRSAVRVLTHWKRSFLCESILGDRDAEFNLTLSILSSSRPDEDGAAVLPGGPSAMLPSEGTSAASVPNVDALPPSAKWAIERAKERAALKDAELQKALGTPASTSVSPWTDCDLDVFHDVVVDLSAINRRARPFVLRRGAHGWVSNPGLFQELNFSQTDSKTIALKATLSMSELWLITGKSLPVGFFANQTSDVISNPFYSKMNPGRGLPSRVFDRASFETVIDGKVRYFLSPVGLGVISISSVPSDKNVQIIVKPTSMASRHPKDNSLITLECSLEQGDLIVVPSQWTVGDVATGNGGATLIGALISANLN
jgi:hypothetical protein